MKKAILALVTSALLTSIAMAAPPADVMAPIRQFVDGFNKGDTASAYAAYEKGNITIVDEFAPIDGLAPTPRRPGPLTTRNTQPQRASPTAS
jgi:hypothetical protein